MWAEPGACTATFGFGKDETQAANCFEFWLNRYQTMVSGILALSAAVVAYLAARAQIRHAENLIEKRRQTEAYAARATLPLALSEVCDYAGACFDIFKSRLPNYKDRSPLDLPTFPSSAVKPLQDCIRFSDKDQAKKNSRFAVKFTNIPLPSVRKISLEEGNALRENIRCCHSYYSRKRAF